MSQEHYLADKEQDSIKGIIREVKQKGGEAIIIVEKNVLSKVAFEHDTIGGGVQGISIQAVLRIRKQGREAILRSNMLFPGLAKKGFGILNSIPKKEYAKFPSPTKYISQQYDPKIAGLKYEEITSHAIELMEGIKGKRTVASNGEVITSTETRLLASTTGIWNEETHSEYHAWGSGVSKSKKSTYTEGESTRKFDSRIPGRISSNVAEKIQMFEKTESLKKIANYRQLPVILTPRTMAELLEHAFLNNLNAEMVEKNKSIFKGQIGKQALGKITITDDGAMKLGMRTSACDDEGTPCRKTALVESGRIIGFIADILQAKKQGIPATGNGGISGPEFTNVIVKPFGTLPEKAIVVDSIIGAHTSNSHTTDFSVKAENGYALLGNRQVALKPFMISGKFVEFLKGAFAAGKDVEENDGVYSGSIAGKCSVIP